MNSTSHAIQFILCPGRHGRVKPIALRRTQPERPRSFRVPFVPLTPLLSIACCLLLMVGLPLETWVRFFVWPGIGLVIYGLFGKRRAAAKA